MKIFTVFYYYHYDDYKRAESDGDIIGLFFEKDKAYKCAVENFKNMFEKYTEYNSYIYPCKKHLINKYLKEKEKNILQCIKCAEIITEKCEVDLNYNDNKFSKLYIEFILDDINKTWKEKYDFIKVNLYVNILPNAEYTIQPTHINYFVKEFEM